MGALDRQVKIGSKYTRHDWDLILTNKSIGVPTVKEEYLPIPSGDGSIDISEALRGEPSYGDRPLSFSFDLLTDLENQAIVRSELMAYVHGQKRKVIEPDDLNHHYIARLKVKEFDVQGWVVKVVIEGTAEPYKYKNELSVYRGYTSSEGQLIFNCKNERKRVLPTILMSNPGTVEFKGNTFELETGFNKLTNIVLSDGDNYLTFNADPDTLVNVEYQEGAF